FSSVTALEPRPGFGLSFDPIGWNDTTAFLYGLPSSVTTPDTLTYLASPPQPAPTSRAAAARGISATGFMCDSSVSPVDVGHLAAGDRGHPAQDVHIDTEGGGPHRPVGHDPHEHVRVVAAERPLAHLVPVHRGRGVAPTAGRAVAVAVVQV